MGFLINIILFNNTLKTELDGTSLLLLLLLLLFVVKIETLELVGH